MKEFNLERIRGHLNITDYFERILGTTKFDRDCLYNLDLIEYESGGIHDNFWILDKKTKERIALFKPDELGGYESYGELFAEEIAKILGMPTAHYDLAVFKGLHGVISYNFLEDESYYAGFDLIADFYERNLLENKKLSKMYNIDYTEDDLGTVNDKLNNLQDIWNILEDKYKNNYYKQQIVYAIMDGLVDKLIFDILTVNVDDHSDNWALMDKKLSPQYDNARILSMNNPVIDDVNELEKKQLLLTVDNSNINKPLKVLEQFIKVSSSEYLDRVVEKVDKLEKNIDYIPLRISKRTEYDVPKYLSSYFVNSMYNHLGNVRDVINKSTKGAKK